MAQQSYGELPLAFEPNSGRYSRSTDFVASSSGGTIALGAGGATLVPRTANPRVEAHPIRMSLAGASSATPAAVDQLPGVVNDLRGSDSSKWVTDIPTYARVRYQGVYPGIDLDYHGTDGTLEYDFHLAAGADPGRIAIGLGAERTRIAENGMLVIGSGSSRIRQAPPVAYQPSSEGRIPVESHFAIAGRGRVGFDLGAFDHSRPLVIDPVLLQYSTYLGGNSTDEGHAIAVDSTGAAYVAGMTTSSDFDTVGPIEGATGTDAFISKLNPSGSALVYSTYLGGNAFDEVDGIAVDSSGAAYIAGRTMSSDFNTVNPIQGDSPGQDAFVSKLNSAGNALTYSTYLGGDGPDQANGIAVNSTGSAYVTGWTLSTDFPKVGEIEGQTNPNNTDAFISKLNPAGSALTYSTYLGGSSEDRANGIAVDSSGAAYVTGYTISSNFNTVGPIQTQVDTDAFVSKLNLAGSALTYSTYLGGTNDDLGRSIAVDSSGSAYVTGETSASDFPTVGPIQGDATGQDGFVSKLNPAGGALTYSTYLGGNNFDQPFGIAVDTTGSAYVTGFTDSTDFPTVGQIEGNSPNSDVFVSNINSAGSALTYSTYLGGSLAEQGNAIAVDSSGSAYVTGTTFSGDFDTAGTAIDPNRGAEDAFVSKFGLPDTTPPDTSITGGPANGSTVATATPAFTFSSAESDVTGFECKVDAAAFAPCTSPATLATLTDGSHTFQVRAKDGAGNVDLSPATRTFTVDTTAPDTQIDSGPTGTIANTNPTFGFSSPSADATGFECRVDAGTFAPCTSPMTVGTLGDGSHTFQVRAKDAVGNIDATPASRTFTVDVTAPDTQIDSGPTGSTEDTTPSFGFSSPAADVAGFECRIDAGTFTTCTSPLVLAPLADGAHTFEVRAHDSVGNTDLTPATRTFTVAQPVIPPAPDPNQACKTSKATITGTKKNDKITGTEGPDVIFAGNGNDKVLGLGGNDVICLGPGNDKTNGGDGNDAISASGGRDNIDGGAGNDILVGSGAPDVVKGGDGDDILNGGPGKDSCDGGTGTDQAKRSCDKKVGIP